MNVYEYWADLHNGFLEGTAELMLDTLDCMLEVENVLLLMEEEYSAGGGTVFKMLRSNASEDFAMAWGRGGGGSEIKLKSTGWLEAVIVGGSGGGGKAVKLKSACSMGALDVFGTAPWLLQPITEGMICGKHQAVLHDI